MHIPDNKLSLVLKVTSLLLLLVVLSVFAWRSLPSEWLTPEWIESTLQGMGVMAPLAFILLRVVAIMVTVVPNAPLDIAGGVLFGPFWGTLYSLIGSELGALACFFLARTLGQDAITQLLHRKLTFSERFAQRELAYLVLFARLEPVFSFSLVSYGAGLTRLSLGAFALSTLIGMLPSTILLNYCGQSLFTGNLSLQIALGLVLVALLLLFPLWVRRKHPHRDK